MKILSLLISLLFIINCSSQQTTELYSDGIRIVATYESNPNSKEELPEELQNLDDNNEGNNHLNKIISNMFSFEFYFHKNLIIKLSDLGNGNFVKLVYDMDTKKTIEFIKLSGILTYNEYNSTNANTLGFDNLTSLYNIEKNIDQTKVILSYNCYNVKLNAKDIDNLNESHFYITDEIQVPKELNIFYGLFNGLPLEYVLSYDDGLIRCKSEKIMSNNEIFKIDTVNLKKTNLETKQKLQMLMLGLE